MKKNTGWRISCALGLMLLAGLAQGQTTLTRTSSFTYDAATGLLTQETIEPNTPALSQTTSYTYDAFGNQTATTVSGQGVTSRTTSNGYDAQGRFATSATNALNQTETQVDEGNFGQPTSRADANNLTTSWTYDSFGRKTSETRPDGTQTTWSYNQCAGSCPTYAVYYVTQTTTGAPTVTIYYDMYNRAVRKQTDGFDGTQIYVDTQYNNLGQIAKKSNPYYAGAATIYWTSYTYDAFGRVLTATAPDNSVTSNSYNGLTTTKTDALNHTTTRTKNSQGQLVQVTDALNHSNTYAYDPFGNLTQTTDAAGHIVTMQYDLRGHKTAMNDPDRGNWTYTYDAFGQLTQQTDAKNQVTTMTYDQLGRMTSRNEPDMISSWTYDTSAHGIGKLASETGANGYQKTYTYDAYGRPSQETTTIDQAYTTSRTYDSAGRVSVITYPTGFAVRNVYSNYGYLSQVVNNATNAVYWTANAQDAANHLTSETLGNNLVTTRAFDPATLRIQSIATGTGNNVQNLSYQFDVMGNLTQRQDTLENTTETFSYDQLNRLTMSSGTNVPTKSLNYDAIGNITYKSDVGNYTYGSQPHAVSSVAGTVNASYTYDANGNMLTGNGRTFTWTSFNMPASISQGSVTDSFNYSPEHQRVKQANGTSTTIYLEPAHYEVVTTGSLVEQKHYIYAGNEMVALYTQRSTGANDTRYFHTDHLGSVNVITDESGNVVERDSFDAWGKRRFPNGSDDPNNTITSLNPRGFTFQEHLDNVGLVHMNGRVYDPLLGRFTSADPFVQFPDSTQGFNRYAYVNNNPLSYTDPSGYDDMPPGIGGFDPGLYINIIGGTPEPSPYPGSEYPDPGAGAFPPSLGIYYPGKGAPGHGSVIGGNLKTAIPGNLYGWTGSMDLSQFGPVSNNMAAANNSLWATPGSSISNATHLGLGAASVIPGLGTFFSGLDAAYYAIQGDYKGASFAAFGMIPFVGALGHITEVGRGVSEALETLNVGSEAISATEGVATSVGKTTVYTSVNESGITQYVGITNNFEARAAAHLSQKDIIIEPIFGLANLSRSDARAVEQVLIEYHGLGKNGGTLMNKINSIASTNPIYANSLNRGRELLHSVGYQGF